MMSRLPNILTYSRIVLIPLIFGLLLFGQDAANWWALALYTFACVTDFLDGYLARAWGQQSAVGKFLDPIADKLLIASLLVVLAGIGRIQGVELLAVVVILCREILVSGLREFLAQVKIGMPVTRMAKWKTGIQMVALGFLVVGPSGPAFGPLTTTSVGIAGLWLAAGATLVSGADYLWVGFRHIYRADLRSEARARKEAKRAALHQGGKAP